MVDQHNKLRTSIKSLDLYLLSIQVPIKSGSIGLLEIPTWYSRPKSSQPVSASRHYIASPCSTLALSFLRPLDNNLAFGLNQCSSPTRKTTITNSAVFTNSVQRFSNFSVSFIRRSISRCESLALTHHPSARSSKHQPPFIVFARSSISHYKRITATIFREAARTIIC